MLFQPVRKLILALAPLNRREGGGITLRKTMLPTLYYIVLAGIIGMIGFYLLGISDPLTKS